MDKGIQEFQEYVVHDILGHLDGITAKKMFGGYGVYQDGVIFALITSNTDLYFKVDESNQTDYEALGSKQFIYTGHKTKKSTTMPYWLLPEEIMEDRDTIDEGGEKSVDVSTLGKKKK